MASKDKNAKQLQIVNDPDAIQTQISPSELEEEIHSSPTSGINHQASAAPLQHEIRTSSRQAARKLSETNFDNDLPFKDQTPAPRPVPRSASALSSVSGGKHSTRILSASAAKSANAGKSVIPSKKAKITPYMQGSPGLVLPVNPGFGLPVGTITAIKIATQLAPHIAAAASSLEYDSRFRDAMAEMQLQLEQQRIKAELEKDKSEALQALLQSIQQQKLTQDHRSQQIQDEQQARHLLADAAIMEERSKTSALQAQLTHTHKKNQQLEQLLAQTSRSQPIMVPSESRSVQRSEDDQASPRRPPSLNPAPRSETQMLQRAPGFSQLPAHLSSSSCQLPSHNTAHYSEPLETIRQNSTHRAPLTATDISIRSYLSRKDSTECDRCGSIHEYVDDLCTSLIDTKGHKCSLISQEEEDHRVLIKITHHFDPTPLPSPGEKELRYSPSSKERDFADEGAYNVMLKAHIRNLFEQQPSPALAQAPAHASASAHTAPTPSQGSVPASKLASAQGSVQHINIRSISASVPAQGLPFASATQIHSSTSAAPQHLSAKAKIEYQKQQILLAQAQQRLTSLSQPGAAKVKQTARQKEKELAIVTNDTELLTKGSVRIKSEANSDDDAEDIAAEQGDAIHCHNLMHPRSKVPVRNSLGFVNSSFIKPDDESESDDGEDDSEEVDDDTSSNYADDSDERDADRLEIKTLRATRSAQAAELIQLRKEASDRLRSEQQELLMYRTAALAQVPVQAATGGRLQVALNPPAHGAWDDVAHLMKTYLPAYEKYKASCGASAETIFSAYSITEKKRLSKLFTKQTMDGELLVNMSVEILSQLSNDQFLELICKEKGYKTSTLTEDALKAIQWKGTFTDKANWINHETNWEDCLAQTSAKGAIDKKRLIVLYRESIPEPFIQKHLATKRFDTWQQAHRHMAEDQIKNADFLIEWNENIRTRKPATDRQQPKQAPNPATGGSSAGGSATHDQPKAAPKQSPANHANALTYTNAFGVLNVNPHLIIDLDMNKERAQCDRCPAPAIHRWPSSMCTAYKGKGGDIIQPRLSPEDTKARKILKWNAGFFMTEDPTAPRPPRQSPSVQETAAAATATNAALHN